MTVTVPLAATIANTGTGCGNYVDYTAHSTTMGIGGSYGVTVTNGYPYVDDQCGIYDDLDSTITGVTDEGSIITFAEEGETFMNQQLAEVAAHYAGNPAYKGNAIHHVGSWMTLQP